jgi:chitinase
VVQAHTNLTEIDTGLDLLWRNDIDPKKVVLGLGFYGRAFTLQDPSCNKPGCPFTGGAKKGKCTGESGILSNSEIQDVVSEHKITPTLVKKDAIKYITWDSDQWVSYDDEETLKMKRDYANKLCLGGTMIWALDLDKPGKDTSINNLMGSELSLSSKWNTLSSKRALIRDNTLSLGLFWTSCQPIDTGLPCPRGYRPIAFGHGKVFDADLAHLTGEGCHGRLECTRVFRQTLTIHRRRNQRLSKGALCRGKCAVRQHVMGTRSQI